MKSISILVLFAASVHAATITASLAIPSLSTDQTTNGWIRQTSSIDQTFNLNIADPYGNTGDTGYLVFNTFMQIAFGSAGSGAEQIEGFGDVQVNNQPSVHAPYGEPNKNCYSYQDVCSVSFTFGVPFTVRLRVTADVEYDYHGHVPQQIHGGSSTIMITPEVYINFGNSVGKLDNYPINGGSFFTQSPTYKNASVVSISDVPEPSTLCFAVCGLACFAFYRRKPTRN
jgi:hypothetical protein